ncbi:MAG: Zn-ribbon domain-containing OB-fold protein [Candidatus Bathyarchaeota archaeon]|nr:MAG: Zn-ribbon domain-containing OB-fold protein [Candidatus Bathyarchaeota archaeon]
MGEFTIKAYNDFLAENKIMGSKCKGCGAVHLPPRPVCNECGGRDLEWTELKGAGTIRAYTVINVPLTRLKDRCPYAVGVVELEGGPSISGMVLGVSDGDQISVGTRVEGEFVKEGERTVLCFRPF